MSVAAASGRRPPNRLAQAKSPYLLQHQFNPVDWYPWGDEAFAKARQEQKPIFLSIGYSTCHWCHVMERESFESDAIAAYLNEHFVSIKLDREERPDVDKVYMTFVQATTGSGGWPLSIFLTPERRPFYGGTYFPPQPAMGRPSFAQLLQHIADAWKEHRPAIEREAAATTQRLSDYVLGRGSATATTPEAAVLVRAAAQLKSDYDPVHGGFGGAPKFPRPTQPDFLLRHGVSTGDAAAIQMVAHTCERMARGGICDQLGGGFARYAVDAEWTVPHFEKMLYDNAQLLRLYLDVYRVTRREAFANVARDIARYVRRDMTHAKGGFFSAEDADSEGKEGKFYCWTREELKGLLSPGELAAATQHFGITDAGNFVDHSDPNPLPHQNVLQAAQLEVPPELRQTLAAAKGKMFAARSGRVRPHLDDKILTSWNGLMLGALASASVVLQDPELREAAERNAAFLRQHLWDPETATLHHRWREGSTDAVELLDDYAFLLSGSLDLYEATLEPGHLEFALQLAKGMVERFHDADAGGFWQSAAGTTDLLFRSKEDYDGAEPSGNSVAAMALLRLARLTGAARWEELAAGVFRCFATRLERFPQALPHLLAALHFSRNPVQRVVISGDPASSGVTTLLRAAHESYHPGRIVMGTGGPVDPFARTLANSPRPTAYVCTGTTCSAPVHEPGALRQLLATGSGKT